MKLKEFREKYSGAPLPLDEFAGLATEVEDDPFLKVTAIEYLHCKEDFLEALNDVEVEIG